MDDLVDFFSPEYAIFAAVWVESEHTQSRTVYAGFLAAWLVVALVSRGPEVRDGGNVGADMNG